MQWYPMTPMKLSVLDCTALSNYLSNVVDCRNRVNKCRFFFFKKIVCFIIKNEFF